MTTERTRLIGCLATGFGIWDLVYRIPGNTNSIYILGGLFFALIASFLCDWMAARDEAKKTARAAGVKSRWDKVAESRLAQVLRVEAALGRQIPFETTWEFMTHGNAETLVPLEREIENRAK
jgi:hypothetical protein